MLSSESVAEKIFKILKGNGHELKLYTDEGSDTVDPQTARRFYMSDTGTMVSLDETDNTRVIKVSMGVNTNHQLLKDTLYQIKNLANRSIIEYTLKNYTKNIEPKDFDFQAQKVRDMNSNSVTEAIGAAYGSSKSSYQKLENARLVIKHNKSVNEEQRGSRSRNISAIYIENAEGERYKFPSNNLAGGRAMLRHVQAGGTPHDDFGSHISEQCSELKKLKEFKRYSEKNGLVNEDTAEIVEAVTARINNIRETLNKMKGVRSYNSMLEEFESKEEQLDEDGLDDIKSKFTVHHFDENVEGALPYVQSLVREMQAVREHNTKVAEAINNLVSVVENSGKTVWVKKGTDIIGDPENPMNHTFENSSARAQLGAVMEYIASVLDESESTMSNLLAEASKMVDSINDDAILGKSARALATLMPKLKPTVSETKVHAEENQWEQDINKVLESYDITKLFP
jgi:hypothetical protein